MSEREREERQVYFMDLTSLPRPDQILQLEAVHTGDSLALQSTDSTHREIFLRFSMGIFPALLVVRRNKAHRLIIKPNIRINPAARAGAEEALPLSVRADT